MSFSSIYISGRQPLSFEFFPPKTAEGLDGTKQLMRELADLGPHLVTVTYGAGGSTRGRTQELVDYSTNTLKIDSVAHLTCVNHSVAEIDEVLDSLKSVGVNKILALRGDAPRGADCFVAHPQGFSCARDLAKHIAMRGDFSIAVAGYPETHKEAKSPAADIEYLKQKVDAGAEAIFTQLFFKVEHYYDFRDRAAAAGISTPIIPGIMPVANVAQIKRFTEMCGASIPIELANKLNELQDYPEEVIKFGAEYATKMCTELISNEAPGIHLYTLNKFPQTREIVRSLPSADRRQKVH